MHGGAGAPEPSVAASSPTPGGNRGKTPVQRMVDRLEGVYESGKVMPVAFLSAAGAAPLALVDHAPAAPENGRFSGGVETNGAAARLVSELAEDARLAAVPQQLREQLKKQVRLLCCALRAAAAARAAEEAGASFVLCAACST